ncbi:hypothetical protein MCEMSEM23_00305 [Rhabdaerophilaceae bacterium]
MRMVFSYFTSNVRERLSALVGAMLGWALLVPFAKAAELVMFERNGCPWCQRWDVEVGAVYPKTPEGQRVPLRRVSLDQRSSEAASLSPPVFYSPTFVLMDQGREVGRITGYVGDDMFWGLFNAMLARIGRAPALGRSP